MADKPRQSVRLRFRPGPRRKPYPDFSEDNQARLVARAKALVLKLTFKEHAFYSNPENLLIVETKAYDGRRWVTAGCFSFADLLGESSSERRCRLEYEATNIFSTAAILARINPEKRDGKHTRAARVATLAGQKADWFPIS